jgi:hypothetical protein
MSNVPVSRERHRDKGEHPYHLGTASRHPRLRRTTPANGNFGRRGAMWILFPLLVGVAVGSVPASAGCVVRVPEGNALRLRAGPSPTQPTVAYISRKACGLSISRCRPGWCLVRHAGAHGWANRNYLRISPPAKPASIAEAKPPYTHPGWQFLTALTVDSSNRSDRIDIVSGDAKYRALLVVVKGAAIKVEKVRVIDDNAPGEDITVQQLIEAGTSSGPIDLGADRGVKHLDLTYGLADKSGPAEVQILGLPASPASAPQASSPFHENAFAQR